MREIQVGTASWTDKSLVDCGRFYPSDAKTPEARLQYYVSQFSLVEIDSSYCAPPSERNAALWVERTPRDFAFDVKVFRLFTAHQTALEALPKDIRDALPPLEAGKRNVYYRQIPPELLDELGTALVRRALQLRLQPAGTLGVGRQRDPVEREDAPGSRHLQQLLPGLCPAECPAVRHAAGKGWEGLVA
jgi:hypothetical protein